MNEAGSNSVAPIPQHETPQVFVVTVLFYTNRLPHFYDDDAAGVFGQTPGISFNDFSCTPVQLRDNFPNNRLFRCISIMDDDWKSFCDWQLG